VELPEVTPADGLVDALEAAAGNAPNWLGIANELRSVAQEQANAQAAWLTAAFDYGLARRVGGGIDRPAFAVRWTIDGQSYPPQLADVPAEILELWTNTAALVSAPALQSRLHHLLFERKSGNLGTHGRRAAAAYLVLGAGSWSSVERVNCLHWAYDLARRVGDQPGADSVVPELVTVTDLGLGQSSAGVALHALEVLASADPTHPALPDLLTRARETFPEVHLAQEVIELQKRIAKGDVARVQQLQREAVQAWLDNAASEHGLLRMAALQDAVQLAAKFGLADMADEATARLQEMSLDDMELQAIGTTFTIPSSIIDDAVKKVVALPSLADALMELATETPPTGDVGSNTVLVSNLAVEAPLMTAVSTVSIGTDGLPRYTSSSDEERHDEQLARVETVNLGLHGEIAARSMAATLRRFSPTTDELQAIIGGRAHVSDAVARTLARALIHFGNSDYEASVAIAVPKLETMARARLNERKALTFRVQRDQNRGQYPQLGTLLRTLRPFLDPSWSRFLWTFLVSPFGPNYRNDLLHGFVDDVTRRDAALVLVAALHLALGTTVEPGGEADTSPSSEGSLDHP
jgi:hypothetical protein